MAAGNVTRLTKSVADGGCVQVTARSHASSTEALASKRCGTMRSKSRSFSFVYSGLFWRPVQPTQLRGKALRPHYAAQVAFTYSADIGAPASKSSQNKVVASCSKMLSRSASEAARVSPELSVSDIGQKTLETGSHAGCSRRRALISLAVVRGVFELPQEALAAGPERSSSASQGGAADTSKGTRKANVFELDGRVKALDVRIGTGPIPQEGDTIAIHYYGRLGAKQGWRFDSSYEHKDLFGVPEPYVFTIGSGQVIAGIDTAVRSMHVGGIRRVVIPPDQGYQNKEQGPVPPDFFDRQRLYTTIFNPTRLANGEGATLGTVIFDLELVRIQP